MSLLLGVILNSLYQGSYETKASFNILSSENYDPFVIFSTKDAPKNYFGGKEEIARTLGILKSKRFVEQIIRKENLISHYGFDSINNGKSKAFKEFGDRYKLNLSKDEGLITVKYNDNSPNKSFEVVSTLIQSLESQLAEEIVTKNNEILKSLIENHSNRVKQSDSVYQEIKKLRLKYGIIDTKSQGEFLSKLSITSPNDEQIKNYMIGIDAIIFLENLLKSESEFQAIERDKIINLQKSSLKPFKAVLMAEKPFLAEERSKPSILIVSAISTFIGFSLSIIIIFTKEYMTNSQKVA